MDDFDRQFHAGYYSGVTRNNEQHLMSDRAYRYGESPNRPAGRTIWVSHASCYNDDPYNTQQYLVSYVQRNGTPDYKL